MDIDICEWVDPQDLKTYWIFALGGDPFKCNDSEIAELLGLSLEEFQNIITEGLKADEDYEIEDSTNAYFYKKRAINKAKKNLTPHLIAYKLSMNG